MRRRLTAILAAVALALANAATAVAGDSPVVVELYTSQGCSSCPPADELLRTLADREDVIALALHVDYWDYIGWKDSFGSPQFTARQKAYARAAGHRTVYTPQMIVGGKDHVVGYKPMHLAQLIEVHGDSVSPVRLSLRRDGGTVRIAADSASAASVGSLAVQLVRYRPREAVAIHRGENAGRTITYANIVTEWRSLGTWDGRAPLRMSAPVSGSEPVVVVLQRPGHGPILAAARVR